MCSSPSPLSGGQREVGTRLTERWRAGREYVVPPEPSPQHPFSMNPSCLLPNSQPQLKTLSSPADSCPGFPIHPLWKSACQGASLMLPFLESPWPTHPPVRQRHCLCASDCHPRLSQGQVNSAHSSSASTLGPPIALCPTARRFNHVSHTPMTRTSSYLSPMGPSSMTPAIPLAPVSPRCQSYQFLHFTRL